MFQNVRRADDRPPTRGYTGVALNPQHGTDLPSPVVPSKSGAPSSTALRRVLRRARDGVALNVDEAAIAMTARGDDLSAGGPARRRQGFTGPPSERTDAKGGGTPSTDTRRKLSYKEQRELEALPAHIEALEAEQQRLRQESESPGFYRESADHIRAVLARLEQVGSELETALGRWMELEERT